MSKADIPLESIGGERPDLKNPALLRDAAYVGGEWLKSDRTISVRNPATGALIATVPRFGRGETREAIKAAAASMPMWAGMPARERAAILRRWYELILANQDDLAKIMTAEQGKPLAEARSEILYAAGFVEWFAEEGKRIYGDVIPTYERGKRLLVLKQPIGVTAAITPWNFPAAMITRKVAPALAAGCPMVVKPASATPFSAMALCVLAEEAGVPKGILSCITGGADDIAGEMTSNPLVRKLSFTGSTKIGQALMRACAENVTKVTLELGGNAPFIVFDDADLDEAIKGAITSKFRNAGQTCVCANRFYVQQGVYAEFVERLALAAAELKVGNGADPGTQIGPLIDRNAAEGLEQLIQDALLKGGRLVNGTGRAAADGSSYFAATVLADATRDMSVAQEEAFGPLAPVFRFRDEADVIDLANDTPYGLAAYLYARDMGRIWRVAEALEVGIVGINTGLISNEAVPFGGVKASGVGREGSKYGIEEYVEVKYLCLGGIDT